MPKLGSRAAARKARVAAKTGRKDPVARHFDGSANWTKLQGKDPKMDYVLASNGHAETGVEYYEDLGYHVVESTAKGVKLGAGKKRQKAGAPIEMRGHTLMAIPKKDRAEIVEYGEDGQTGQQLFDTIEEKIVADGGADSLRGKLPDHLSVRSTTSDTIVEEG